MSPFYLAITWPAAILIGSYFGGWFSFMLYFYLAAFLLSNRMELLTRKYLTSEGLEPEAHHRCLKVYVYFAFTVNLYFMLTLGLYDGLTQLGIILSLGLTNGVIGVPAAHEYVHKRQWQQWLGLAPMAYCHFSQSHMVYHHQKFGTVADKSNSPRGRTLYQYLWIVCPWRVQTLMERPKKEIILNILGNLIFPAMAFATGSYNWIFVIIASHVFFENIDYLSHYGLDPDKYYRRDKHYASWNLNGQLMHYFTFNIANHSDHHANGRKPFYKLENVKAAPQYKLGGTSVLGVVVAPFFPKYFMKKMDAILDSNCSNSKFPKGLPLLDSTLK